MLSDVLLLLPPACTDNLNLVLIGVVFLVAVATAPDRNTISQLLAHLRRNRHGK